MQATPRSEPEPSLPQMPGYGVGGVPGERLGWRRVEELLIAARCYWLCTVRPDGRPHAAPVWGAWLEDALVFDSGRESRKTRNIQTNSEVVVHLESATETVIVEGAVEELRDQSVRARFAEAYRAKYHWPFDPNNPPGVIYIMRPRVAFSWYEDLGDSATRWRFRTG